MVTNPNLDIASATTTDYTNTVDSTTTPSASLDQSNAEEESYWYFSNANKNLGYYTTRPEVHSTTNTFSVWAFGKGVTTDDLTKVVLEHITGWGQDTFQSVIQQHFIMKKIIGDAFAEIITNDNKPPKTPEDILNLIPHSAERVRLVLTPKGRIKGYDVSYGGKWRRLEKGRMFHSSNNRIADQIHGTSAIDAVEWIVLAKKEALEDERTIRHRDKALGIVYYKTSDTGKIAYANSQIEKAVNKGEMVGLPLGSADIQPFPNKTSGERQAWLQILDGLFYQNFQVPRIIATSEGAGEAGSKMGYMTFDPPYTNEQTLMEADMWNQLGMKVKFNRPPSLHGVMAENETKNTGQIGTQPADVTGTAGRVE